MKPCSSRKRGEDEVGVGDREEIALGLRAFVGALAPDASRADGDLGLEDLVAAAFGVVLRVDEAGKAGDLVVLEDLAGFENAADQEGEAEDENAGLLPGDAAQKEADREEPARR